MSWLERVDGFLLDRVAQPIFDRLPGGVTCFDVGRSLLVGDLVFTMADVIVSGWASKAVWGFVATALCVPGMWRCVTIGESAAKRGLRNPWRLSGVAVLVRLAAFPITAWIIVPRLVEAWGAAPDATVVVKPADALCWLGAMVAMACRLPPPPKRETAPAVGRFALSSRS